MFVSSVIMYSTLRGIDVPNKLHWIPGEPGYLAHMFSTVSEWCLAFSFISFFLTYIRDFQKICLRADVDLLSSHLYDSPHDSINSSRRNPSETSPLLAGAT
ncbi:DNA damage-regulated autophagy modulator protein 2 [Austrofundulus limnaeus]|nr:PREDICTED: DNA damage-regulated autophagy modulator protein 2-like [Austrofundulus limnaeus]